MPRSPADPDSYTMSFGEHLEELRTRLIHALIGLAVACVVTFYFVQDIVAWLAAPVIHAMLKAEVPAHLIATHPLDGFTLLMKVGLIAGLILASPWILYQLWKFIAAGLYATERRVVLLLAPFSALMTILGVLFSYVIMLPLALMFLIGVQGTFPLPDNKPTVVDKMMDQFPGWTRNTIDWMNGTKSLPPQPPATAPGGGTQPAEAQPMLAPILGEDPIDPDEGQIWIKMPEHELRVRLGGETRVVSLPRRTLIQSMIAIDPYIDFVIFMTLGIVIAFQVPVLMLILGWTGVIEPGSVSRYRKHYIFGAFIAAAILTPTGDPFNLTLLAVPLWLLFELGLIVMRIAHWRQKRRAAPAGEE